MSLLLVSSFLLIIAGSAHSLNGSSSCSKISQSDSSCDSNQSVAGSSGGERDSESVGCTNDSDVEILSNPSQSSIEVLEYNASRKHSEDRRYSDEQNPAMTLSLDSMADQINRLLIGEQGASRFQNQQTSTQDLMAKVGEESARQPAADDRKTVLSQAHLTESSSSGSVTDSICTTYEQNNTSPLAKSTTQIESKPPAAVTPTAANRTPTKQATTPTATMTPSKLDNSVISSMFGGNDYFLEITFTYPLTKCLSPTGLFQSTNSLMSRSQRSPEKATARCDPFRYSYTQFDEVDHRLKLYLYKTVFEDDNEQLKWLVNCEMFGDKWSGVGIFVLSTTKFYALQAITAEW